MSYPLAFFRTEEMKEVDLNQPEKMEWIEIHQLDTVYEAQRSIRTLNLSQPIQTYGKTWNLFHIEKK